MTDLSPPGAPAGHDLVVVGASLGGLDALRALMGSLPQDLPAAVLVVQHTSARSPGMLGALLDGAGPLPARLAEDGDALRTGEVLVAPPDHHLVVEAGRVRLHHGPKVNLARPAVDVLFRSAAVTYGTRVVGVVLSGLLDDGTAGLAAVQQCGGAAVVQDPADAAYPEMPESALRAVPDAHAVRVADLGRLLGWLTGEPAGEPPPIPDHVLIEHQLITRMRDRPDQLDAIGRRSTVTCPECGGLLWELAEDGVRRYQCHVGHAYTERVLNDAQATAVEEALFVALRTLEDRAKVLRKMAGEASVGASSGLTEDYDERAADLDRHADQLRTLLLSLQNG